jgi:hypothetical protein
MLSCLKSLVACSSLAAVCIVGHAKASEPRHQGVAPTLVSALPHLVNDRPAEMIAPAATVTSTVHYQVQIDLTCNSTACTGDFPRPGLKRQINLRRVSCVVLNDQSFQLGTVALFSSTGSFLLQEFLPVGFSSSNGFHTLDQAVDLQILNAQRLTAILIFASGPSSPSGASCTATGTLSTLS